MELPRKAAIQMINLCLENSSQFITDAMLIHSLLQDPIFDHSIASIQFAVEELGKASIIKKGLLKNQNERIQVPDNLFGSRGSHELKEKEGWSLLNKCSNILTKAAFDPDCFDPRDIVTTDVKVTHDERLRCLFVDYKNERVIFSVPFEKENLKTLIGCIEEELEKIKDSWVH